jgi:hypothetical protein
MRLIERFVECCTHKAADVYMCAACELILKVSKHSSLIQQMSCILSVIMGIWNVQHCFIRWHLITNYETNLSEDIYLVKYLHEYDFEVCIYLLMISWSSITKFMCRLFNDNWLEQGRDHVMSLLPPAEKQLVTESVEVHAYW